MLVPMNATVIPFPIRSRPPCWSTPVHEVIDEIESVLDQGDAAAVIELCRQALARLDAGSPDIDDVGPLDELVVRLDEVHRRACAVARPDAVELARWLFRAEVDSNLHALVGAPERYAELLGDRGLAEYGRLMDRRLRRRQSDLGRRIDDFSLGPTRASLARARHPSAV